MDENRIVELLTRKIAGEASAEELGELSYLLSKHPDSIYYEALLEQVWDLDKQDPIDELKGTFQKHKLKFRDDLKFRKSDHAKGFFGRQVVFAITLTCLFFGIAVLVMTKYKPQVKSEIIEIIAGKGVRKEIKLPDGTVVRLNSDSRISYDRNMLENPLREVKLRGEAFFRVAHDNEHAFIATTNKVAVRVLGTEFNMKEYPGEGNSETTLLKGSIELVINDRSDQKFLLRPLEKFALLQKSKEPSQQANNSVLMIEHVSPVKVGNTEYLSEITWVDNKLVFQNESFAELLPKLERWYNVEIDLSDPQIKSYKFTGILMNENIVQALGAMQLIKPFNYKLTANEIKIY